MNERFVVSLEMAKKLKGKGFPQDTEFYWKTYTKNAPESFRGDCKLEAKKETASYKYSKGKIIDGGIVKYYSSPLISELLDQLTNMDIFDYCDDKEAMTQGEFIDLFRSPDRLAEIWLEVNGK